MTRWAVIQTRLDDATVVAKLDGMFDMPNCTRIVAHRRTTMMSVDRLVVFDDDNHNLDAWLEGAGGIAGIDLVDTLHPFGWPVKRGQLEAANKTTPLWLLASIQPNQNAPVQTVQTLQLQPLQPSQPNDTNLLTTKLFGMNQNINQINYSPNETSAVIRLQNVSVLLTPVNYTGLPALAGIICAACLCVTSPTSITVQQCLDSLSARHNVKLTII